MEFQQTSSRSYFKSLQIIYFAMMIGQIIFAGIAYYLIESGGIITDSSNLRDIFIYIVPVFVVGGIFGSTAVYTKTVFQSRSIDNLSEKLAAYRSALIVKYAILEGVAFFAIVVCLITGDIVFLGMAALIIMVFVMNRPNVGKAEMDLALDQDEKTILNDPNGIID